MKTGIGLLILFLSFFVIAQAPGNQKALVFTHVTVIDGTGAAAKPDRTVVIKGDRIAELGENHNVHVAEGDKVVDATGKFLISDFGTCTSIGTTKITFPYLSPTA